MSEILSQIDGLLAEIGELAGSTHRVEEPAGRDAEAGPPTLRMRIPVIKHFACTGGSLFAKCLKCTPNTMLISEFQPGVAEEARDPERFAPTDWLHHIGLHQRELGVSVMRRISIWAAYEVAKAADSRGLGVIYREHSHSKYCRGDAVRPWPDLEALLSRFAETSAIVTVRDPVESYLSLQRQGWVHFTPADFDEYCRRYLAFLDDNRDRPFFRYEDLCAQPSAFGAFSARHLGIGLPDNFDKLFSAQSTSGNSGVSFSELVEKPRRSLPADLKAQMRSSGAYAPLVERLGYPRRDRD